MGSNSVTNSVDDQSIYDLNSLTNYDRESTLKVNDSSITLLKIALSYEGNLQQLPQQDSIIFIIENTGEDSQKQYVLSEYDLNFERNEEFSKKIYKKLQCLGKDVILQLPTRLDQSNLKDVSLKRSLLLSKENQKQCMKCNESTKKCYMNLNEKKCNDMYQKLIQELNNDSNQEIQQNICIDIPFIDSNQKINDYSINNKQQQEENKDKQQTSAYLQPQVMQRYLASENAEFRLVSKGVNEVTVEVLQVFHFLVEMYEAFEVIIEGISYDKIMLVKNYTFITYKFTFTQIVPDELTTVLKIILPQKMQPNPTTQTLSLTIKTQFIEDTSAKVASSVTSKIVKYFILLTNYAYIISIPFSKDNLFQPLIFFQQGLQQISSFNEFPASSPIREFFEEVYGSHFDINISDPTAFYMSKRILQENQSEKQIVHPQSSRILFDNTQFYPKREQLTSTSLEVNSGLYLLLGLALISNIILVIMVLTEKFSDWRDGVKIFYRFQVYFSICFLCYFGTCQDSVYRYFHSISTSSLEPKINYALLGAVTLQSVYMIPVMLFCEKESHQSSVGNHPFSFFYMNLIVNSKRHFYLYVPVRMVFILIGAILRCIMISLLPYFLIGQHIIIIAYLVTQKPYRKMIELIIDCVNSGFNIIELIVLCIISGQSLFKEDMRVTLCQIIVYLGLVQTLFNAGITAYRIIKAYQFYKYEKNFGTKIVPVEVFIPQTKAAFQGINKASKGLQRNGNDTQQLQIHMNPPQILSQEIYTDSEKKPIFASELTSKRDNTQRPLNPPSDASSFRPLSADTIKE